MTNQNNGGPAFPVPLDDFQDYDSHPAKGVSIRDYFAGQVLMGFMANPDLTLMPEQAAECAYDNADAMLKEREKQNE